MPKEVIEQVRALMQEGYSESSAYAIAVANYKRRHGKIPQMHHKVEKKFGVPKNPSRKFAINANQDYRLALVLQESNNNRNTQFLPFEQVLAIEQLKEMKAIRALLERRLK